MRFRVDENRERGTKRGIEKKKKKKIPLFDNGKTMYTALQHVPRPFHE